MVGYKEEDSLTQTQKLFAGVLSGCVTRFVTQPFDVIKIRTQLVKKNSMDRKVWFPITRKILRNEGITAFWHGHNIGQIHSIIAVSTQFYVYEVATKYAAGKKTNEALKPLMTFLCGATAGVCSTTLVIPLEVIRLRQMIIKEQYRGILNGAKAVYSTGGILAFYEGLSASLMQMGPAVGISFTVFTLMQNEILKYLHDCDYGECKFAPGNDHKPGYILAASTVAGTCAGFISKTITYPFDLVKKRLQIKTHKDDVRFKRPGSYRKLEKCKKLTECLKEIYKTDGLPGLFRGWKVTIYKAQLTSIIAFTTYELTCYAIREISL